MADIRLVTYLRDNMRAGYDKYELCNTLVAAGHPANAVKEALDELVQETMPTPPRPVEQPPVPPKPAAVNVSLLALVLVTVIITTALLGYWMVKPTPTEEVVPIIPEEIVLAPPICGTCEYLQGNSCRKAACCTDADCDDNISTTADVCEAPGGQEARCIRTTVQCGNGNCEKGETCCVDCGCAAGFMCIENACVTERTPTLNILSPQENDTLNPPVTVRFEVNDAAIGLTTTHVHLRLDQDKTMEIFEEKPVQLDLGTGYHEVTMMLADKDENILPDTTRKVGFTVAAPKVPTVMVTHPTVNEQITGDTVTVSFSVTDITLGPDELILILDGKSVTHTLSAPYIFSNVSAGDHVLEVFARNAQGARLTNPESFKTIPFTTTIETPSDLPPSPSTQLNVTENVVVLQNTQFTPQAITVKNGTSVTWINKDPFAHTVTASHGFFDSGQLEAGFNFTKRFEMPGTYDYVCNFHPGMSGTVIVEE
ncbi:cupredoxin domain-containing protein [Candidatus Woesearchaeota archaeon]|nr:cupredoxin domain-containing protein [Candidatus Woesearchaeota archaeon]